MSKYRKFELEELPKSAVVNSGPLSEGSEIDSFINDAVSQHLNTVVGNVEPSDECSISNDEGEVKEPLETGKVLESAEEKLTTDNLDLEAIKQEAFLLGVKETQAKYEKQIEELSKDREFLDLLKQKLLSIVPENKLDSQVAMVSAEAIAGIAKKLHLILPANFEEIVRKGLFEKLKNFYKEGAITLTVHPERYAFCTEVLQSDEIPSKFKDNFQITQDDKLNKDDCILEWSDTRLEYNQSQLSSEIDKIIDQLKSAA